MTLVGDYVDYYVAESQERIAGPRVVSHYYALVGSRVAGRYESAAAAAFFFRFSFFLLGPPVPCDVYETVHEEHLVVGDLFPGLFEALDHPLHLFLVFPAHLVLEKLLGLLDKELEILGGPELLHVSESLQEVVDFGGGEISPLESSFERCALDVKNDPAVLVMAVCLGQPGFFLIS